LKGFGRNHVSPFLAVSQGNNSTELSKVTEDGFAEPIESTLFRRAGSSGAAGLATRRGQNEQIFRIRFIPCVEHRQKAAPESCAGSQCLITSPCFRLEVGEPSAGPRGLF